MKETTTTTRTWWQHTGLSGITRAEWIFVLFLMAFCTLFTFVELNNHKLWTNDFKVYYDATHDFFSGHNPYQHHYGLDTGFFKYPPFALYLFAPQTFVSYGVGQCTHLMLLAFSLIFSLLNIRKLLERYPVFGSTGMPVGMLYLVFVCVAIHLTRELHLGNINLILLLLFNLGLRSLLKGKDGDLAAWWSLMLILKPIMILVVLPLLLHKKWKAVGIMAAFGVLFFVFPALSVGWNGNLVLWQDWFKAISAHGDYLTSYNALGTLTKIYTGLSASWLMPLLCLFVLIVLMVRERMQRGVSVQDAMVWSVIFSAFIPNFFVTDTEHFLLSAPLIWFLLSALRNGGKWYHWAGFFAGMLCFSFNSMDLLGRSLSDFLYDKGFLGIGNLIFLITFLALRRSISSQQEKSISPIGNK